MEKLIIWIVLLVFFYLMNRISHMEKESGYGLSGGGATCDNKGGTQMGVS